MKTSQIKQKEKEVLQSITEIAGEETAKKVKAYFSPEQWNDSWKGYLHKLEIVRTALLEEVSVQMIFDCVNAGIKLEHILVIHRMTKAAEET